VNVFFPERCPSVVVPSADGKADSPFADNLYCV
jgi:hypothetical protein